MQEGTAELIAWDGTQVAAILTGEDGVGSSCLIDPSDGATVVLDRRSGGRLVDAWAGASLVRVGPRGYRDLIMLRGLTEIALLPYDPGSTTDAGIILDDHSPRRLRAGLEGELTELYQPAKFYGVNSPDGYVRALIRSENGTDHARLFEVTTTPDGVSYQVVAERPGYELDEFTVSDDLSTVALLWNINGASELQILEYADNTLHDPIPLPGMVASELSISAGGSMLAMTVEGPSMPPTVELVDPRTREWEPRRPRAQQRARRRGPHARDHHRPRRAAVHRLAVPPAAGRRTDRRDDFPARRARRAGPPRIQRVLPAAAGSGHHACSFRMSAVPGDSAARSCTPTTGSGDSRRSTTSPTRRCYLVDRGLAPKDCIACCGWSYGGYLTQAALTFHPQLFAAGISICGMSDLNTWYRNTEPWIAAAAHPKYGHPVSDRELLDQLSPLLRAHALTAPLLLVHGLNDTNVPPTRVAANVRRLAGAGPHTSNCWSSTTTAMRSTSARTGPCWSEPCATGSPRRSQPRPFRDQSVAGGRFGRNCPPGKPVLRVSRWRNTRMEAQHARWRNSRRHCARLVADRSGRRIPA